MNKILRNPQRTKKNPPGDFSLRKNIMQQGPGLEGNFRHLVRIGLLSGVLQIVIFSCLSPVAASPVFLQPGSERPDITVSGNVTSQENGEALPGVNILVKGTLTGTTSDFQGSYTLTVNEDATLVFSFIGYQSLEVQVNGRSKIDISLTPDLVQLGEVVVIGYGTQSRRTITTAISRVGSEKLEGLPHTSIATALQGKIAGTRISQSAGGQPGADATIRIRSGSSINKSNDPLVLIDGMVRELADINPNDIESVQVLKDASSTTIYGARASNGVVLVTTKKGKFGRAEINFETNQGIATPWKYLDLLGAEDYVRITREALGRSAFRTSRGNIAGASGTGNGPNSPFSLRYLADGEDIPPGYLSMADPIDPTRTLIFQDNDFQDLTLNPALEQNYYLSANGGTEKIKFAAGIGYNDNEGISVGTGYSRLSARVNTDFVLSEKLDLSTRVDHTTSNTNAYDDQANIFNRSIWLAPTAKVYMDDGSYATGHNATFTNPLWYNTVRKNDLNQYRTNIGATLSWNIVPGLEAKLSGDYLLSNRMFESFYLSNPFNASRPAVFTYNQTNRYQVEGVLTYSKSIAQVHHINALVGISELTYKDFSSRSEARGGSSDKIQTLNAGPIKIDARTERTGEVLNGMFGRLTYDYKEKYLLAMSLRRDGSSLFAPGNNIGYFPGVSVGWLMTEEDFLKNNQMINFLKLRGSLGQTGNNSVARYAYAGEYQVGNNYFGMAGLLPTVMPNTGLKWETTTQWDVGFDLNLFKGNRVNIMVDYFDKITSNLLFNVPLPRESGFNNIDQNIGKVRFYGYEFEIDLKVIDKGDFQWRADFNLGYSMNEVLELPYNGIPKNRIGGLYIPEDPDASLGGIAEGERMFSVWAPKVAFIIDTWEQANNAHNDASAIGWSPLDNQSIKGRKIPGDFEWVDKNGDGIINNRDQFLMGYNLPTTTGGVTNNIRWKNFELNVFMDYALGGHSQNAVLNAGNSNLLQGSYNPTTMVLGAWKKEGDAATATMPRFDHHDNQQQSNLRGSDWTIYSTDYLCFRELKLSYKPKSLTSMFGLRSLQITLAGQNLYYFTEFPGWVPDGEQRAVTDENSYPIPRKIVVGLKVGF